MNEVFSGITRIVVYLSGAKGKKGAARRYLLKSSGRHDDVIEVSGPAFFRVASELLYGYKADIIFIHPAKNKLEQPKHT